MRPIQLKMSAFGSYGGEEVVDFTKLEQGIFLISGDTGAGKTTIFDGIMYALYDVTSGGKRDGSMMRSQYAPPQARTYVDFTFSCKGRTYRIFRNPEYERESLRRGKNGEVKMAKEKPRLELYLDDGSMYPGTKREVNQKIQEIIGLDGEQFTQVVMIAQGEFLKLLHAKSEERKEIFTQIFHTRIYGRMQEELRRRDKEAWQRVKDREKAYELQRSAIRWDEESYSLEEKDPESKELLEALDELIFRGEEKERALEKQLAYLLKLDHSLKEIQTQEQECCHLNEERKQLEDWLHEQSGRLAALEAQSREKEETRRRMGEVFAARRALFVQAEAKCRSLAAKQSLYEECLERQKRFAASGQFWKIQQTIWETKSQERKLAVLEDKMKALDLEQKQQKRIYQLWQERDTAYKEKTAAYELANERFFKAQAGILALELEEGVPCPVCGSIHHPLRAALPKEAPDQEQVRRLRKEQGDLEDQREELQRQLMEKNQRVASLATEVSQIGQYAFDPDFVCERQWFLRALDKRKVLMNDLRQLEQEKKGCKIRIGDSVDDYDAFSEESDSFEKFQKEIENAAKNLAKAQEEGAALQAEIQLLKKDMGDTDPENVSEKIREIDREAKNLEREAAMALERQRQFTKEYHQKSGEAHLMKEKLKQAEEAWKQKKSAFEAMTLESKEHWKDRLPDELLRTEKCQKEIYSQNDSNRICRRQLEQIAKEYDMCKQEYEQIHHLSSLAGGTLSGSIKMDFESYVQRQYFKQVIAHANTRLMKMTSGQFILKCRELGDLKNQGKVGLDLDVYSMVTQKTRNVQTLSGGESFMAALCMALGLADVIQNAAGGISLETMFIDEGFGSLDDHAREQAIRVLYELAGDHRMIGIISHVTELKEQIEQQILVDKGVHGSWIRQNAT